MTGSELDLSFELERLGAAHPLPEGWRVPECFVDSTSVAGLSVHVVGLLALSDDGREVTGSAGARDSHPLSRAYFELLERVVAVDVERGQARDYPLFDADLPVGRVAGANVVPPGPADSSFRYSRSNGVAAGSSWQMACEAARAELVERDRVLRSWYGQTRPVPRPLDPEPALSALEPHYHFEAYTFPGFETRASNRSYEVVGLFGFPKTPEAPLISGMAAASSGELAFSKALGECLQRWAFLWGETIPDSAPDFACTAEYHQELFLWPKMHERLKTWLCGGHFGAARFQAASDSARAEVRFIGLQRGVAGGVSVAKATPGAELPLVFGSGHPVVEEPLAPWLRVHPIA